MTTSLCIFFLLPELLIASRFCQGVLSSILYLAIICFVQEATTIRWRGLVTGVSEFSLTFGNLGGLL